MSKNFNLSIPKKRLRSARFKLGKYFSSTAFSGAALSLVLAGALILPQTAQAQDENVDNDPPSCTIARGTITTSPQSATFTPGDADTDIDFKITCTGALQARLDKGSIEALFVKRAAATKADNTAAYDPEESITMIDLSAVTGNGLSFALDPATAILAGTLTNDGSIKDRRAVEVNTESANSHDIDAENRATIVVLGDGRVAIAAYRHEDDTSGGGITLKNYGSITTEGKPCDRSDSAGTCYDSTYAGPNPYRRANGIHAGIDNPVASGDVMVTNEGATATITVEGDGASGIDAYNSGTGNTEVVNSGAVITKGELWEPAQGKKYRPRAVNAWANSGSATATNKAGGEVTTGVMGDATKGQEGNAVSAFTGDDDVPISGAAMATNEGEITTYGANARGLHASTDADDPGKATVMNAATGTITTHGAEAYGMSTWVSGLPGTTHEAEGTNAGTITTDGDEADGMHIFASDSTDSSSRVTASNSGTIEVNGDTSGTNGIVAGFNMNRDPERNTPYSGGALGKVTVTNTGTVTATGDEAVAIAGGFWAADNNTIRDSGNVDITIDGGKVMASGAGSTALVAQTHGSGRSTITIENSAVVNGSQNAVEFMGGSGTLTIDDSQVSGDIVFTDNDDDVLNIVVGEESFVNLMGNNITKLETMSKRGPGIARINDVMGRTLNLEDGRLVVAGHLDLSGGELTIHEMGKLVFEIGDVTAESHTADDPNHGKLTVGTLIFRSTDAANHEVFVQLNEELNAAQVTAVKAEIQRQVEWYLMDVVELRNGAEGAETTLLDESTLHLQSESSDGMKTKIGRVIVNQGSRADPAVFEDADMIAKLDLPEVMMSEPGDGSGSSSGSGSTPTSTAAGSSSSGGGGGGGAILGLGLLAVLLNSFVGDDDASASFGDYYFNTPQSAYIASVNERGVMTIKETGNQPYQMWIRTGHTAQPMQMTGVSNTGVSGTEVGFNLYNSDTFYINTSVAPNVAAEVGSLNLAGKGEVYSLNSGWRNDRYFAGLRLSHGEFEVNSIVDNPIVNSALISNAKLRNTQAQLRAGMNLGTGALRFTPSAAVQVGTYESSEHVAESPALEAAIPGYAQDYTSVQLGLKMSSDKWLSFSNGSKWKPQLKFDSIHTDSTDAGSLTLRQSDKAGALSFNTNAGLRSMPEVVNSMSFGATVKSSANDQAEWKFGFAGLEADGEEYYAAMAAYQLRF